MRKILYETPVAEVINVLAEQGFAASSLVSDFEEAGEDRGTWE